MFWFHGSIVKQLPILFHIHHYQLLTVLPQTVPSYVFASQISFIDFGDHTLSPIIYELRWKLCTNVSFTKLLHLCSVFDESLSFSITSFIGMQSKCHFVSNIAFIIVQDTEIRLCTYSQQSPLCFFFISYEFVFYCTYNFLVHRFVVLWACLHAFVSLLYISNVLIYSFIWCIVSSS